MTSINAFVLPSVMYLRIANKKKPVLHKSYLHDQILENVDQNPYLGVLFTNTLKWDTHINNILAKANKSLLRH
jgi:hypothetical protein